MDIRVITPPLEPALGVDDLPAAPGPADPDAALRFSELIDAPDAGTAAKDIAPVDALAPTGPRTLGDQILGGLQNVSTELKHTWASVGEALEGSGTLGVREMLRMQMDLSQMSVQYELVSKAVTRSTQNIDQLVKLQ